MRQADAAMYAAKRDGKNRVMHYTPEIGIQVHERMTLGNLLRGAVGRREIFVHYQPEFDLTDNRLLRFEALARWKHPTLGMIPPDKFIPIAEESGIIGALGATIMEMACTEAVRWQSMAAQPIQIGVNVSSIQFRHKGFVEELKSILARTGLRPDLLQIEVTESVMMGANEQAKETMNYLRAMGISMAIDDFGTGYSNLSYLPSLSFDALKIDRSFMLNLEFQPETESMIQTLIALAQNLGMRVIIEGVETAEQLALIKSLGANEVQGYFMGRPTPNPQELIMLAVAS
jgi:EAL domain-containing protein (putative c-di-GMP-specific phosphodiesterase class I)